VMMMAKFQETVVIQIVKKKMDGHVQVLLLFVLLNAGMESLLEMSNVKTMTSQMETDVIRIVKLR